MGVQLSWTELTEVDEEAKAMAIRKIATIGHPVLRGETRRLTREELALPDLHREVLHGGDPAPELLVQVLETDGDGHGQARPTRRPASR